MIFINWWKILDIDYIVLKNYFWVLVILCFIFLDLVMWYDMIWNNILNKLKKKYDCEFLKKIEMEIFVLKYVKYLDK